MHGMNSSSQQRRKTSEGWRSSGPYACQPPPWPINGLRLGAIQPQQNERTPCQLFEKPRAERQWPSNSAFFNDIDGEQTFVSNSRAQYLQRRDRMLELLNGIPGIPVTKPQGAFYLYPSVADLIGRTTPGGQVLQSDLRCIDLHMGCRPT